MIWLFFCLVLAKSRHMKAKYYEAVMSVVTDLTDLTEDILRISDEERALIEKLNVVVRRGQRLIIAGLQHIK